MLEHATEIDIPFHDVDMMRITWHGHYVRYLEVARCAFLDHIGYGYESMFESGYAWPIIDLQLRYVKPSRFGERIRVQVVLQEWEMRLKLGYLITNAQSGERLTKASTVQVAMSLESGEMCYPSPAILKERLDAAGL